MHVDCANYQPTVDKYEQILRAMSYEEICVCVGPQKARPNFSIKRIEFDANTNTNSTPINTNISCNFLCNYQRLGFKQSFIPPEYQLSSVPNTSLLNLVKTRLFCLYGLASTLEGGKKREVLYLSEIAHSSILTKIKSQLNSNLVLTQAAKMYCRLS